jgi:hypothetical protein
VHLTEQIVDTTTGELVKATNPIPCLRCRVKPETQGLLTDEQLQEWMAEVPWRFATTQPEHPHEYSLRKWQNPERFDLVARTIWHCGWDRRYLNRPWRTLLVAGYICWVWTRPKGPRMPFPEDTILVNRTRANQLEQLQRGAS